MCIPRSELPNESEGGNILAMARDTSNQTPDLFTAGRFTASSTSPSEAVPGRPSRRTALPTDLPKAMRYLAERDLDLLLWAALYEAKRRGRPVPVANPTNTPANPSEPFPKQTKPPGRPTNQRQTGLTAAALTRGQVNAVQAAFKAGVTPARIARQFGLSQSQVRRALSSGEPSR
jgi:hypothetical protein